MLRRWHVPFCTCLQSLGEKEKVSVEVLSADVEMLTPFLGLDKQLPISQLLSLACLHMAEVGISLLGRSCRRVPGSSQTQCSEGLRTTEQWWLLCLPSRNLLSGGNNMVLNNKLLLFPIKQKLLSINHLIPELCSSISLSLLLSPRLLLTILATHMSFNAVSLQNGFLIK